MDLQSESWVAFGRHNLKLICGSDCARLCLPKGPYSSRVASTPKYSYFHTEKIMHRNHKFSLFLLDGIEMAENFIKPVYIRFFNYIYPPGLILEFP